MRMCALSNVIREKLNWWEKIRDPALVEKWKQEALDQQEGEYRTRQLTKRMVNAPHFRPSICDSTFSKIDYLFQELHGYASIRDCETGIEVRWHPNHPVPLRKRFVVGWPLRTCLEAGHPHPA